MAYYASGCYGVAKRQRLAHGSHPEPAIARTQPVP
jgi:hypothetical protein